MGLGGREEGGVGGGRGGEGDAELEHHAFQGLPRHGTLKVTSPIFDTFCYLYLKCAYFTCERRKLKKGPMPFNNFEDH